MTDFERAARRHIASRGSIGTRKLYTADLESWLDLCQCNEWDPDHPQLDAAAAFRDELAKTKSPATVRRSLSALCSMYDSYGGVNPFKSKQLTRPKQDEVSPTEVFTPEQSAAIFAEIEKEIAVNERLGLRDWAIVKTIYATGMRVSTACGMRRDCIRERDDKFFLITPVKMKGRVEVALPDEAIGAIHAWLEIAPASPWVFPRDGHPAEPLTTKAAAARVATYGARCGIKNASPHRFRAAYITEALDAGIPLHEIQASVHHSSVSSTLRYDRGKRGGNVAETLAKHRSGK